MPLLHHIEVRVKLSMGETAGHSKGNQESSDETHKCDLGDFIRSLIFSLARQSADHSFNPLSIIRCLPSPSSWLHGLLIGPAVRGQGNYLTGHNQRIV